MAPSFLRSRDSQTTLTFFPYISRLYSGHIRQCEMSLMRVRMPVVNALGPASNCYYFFKSDWILVQYKNLPPKVEREIQVLIKEWVIRLYLLANNLFLFLKVNVLYLVIIPVIVCITLQIEYQERKTTFHRNKFQQKPGFIYGSLSHYLV